MVFTSSTEILSLPSLNILCRASMISLRFMLDVPKDECPVLLGLPV